MERAILATNELVQAMETGERLNTVGKNMPQIGPKTSRSEKLLDMLSRGLCSSAFFLMPFLGGNHLALPQVTIDRFWIETSFLVLLMASAAASFLRGNRPKSGLQAFLVYFAPLFVVSSLSLIYTWNMYSTAKELNVLLWVIGAVYLYSSISDKEVPLRALVWGSVASVVCAVLQLKVLFPQLSATFTSGWYASMLQDKPVPFVAFLNENMFGGYLLLTLPISISLGFYEKRKAYAVTTPIIIIGVLLSLSRLSLIVMVLELSAVCVVLALTRGWRRLAGLVVMVAAATTLFFLSVYVQGSPSEKNIENSFKGKTSTALDQVKTLNLRTSIWRGGAQAFKERPAIGYGAGAFDSAFRKHFGGRLYTRYAHGGIVKVAVELGLLGVIAYLWYFFGIVRGARETHLRPPLLLLAVTGGLLFGLVDCALDTAAFVVTFFVISSEFLVSNHRVTPVGGKSLFVSILVLLLLSFAFTGRAGLAKKTIEEGILFEEMGNPSAAADSYEQAFKTMPVDNEPRIRLITVLAKRHVEPMGPEAKQRIADVIYGRWNQIGLRRDEDSELLFVNALGYMILGKEVRAYECINKAIWLYPSSPYYVSQAVDWYLLAGELEKANSFIDRFEPFVENIRTWGNPNGLYVYRLRELRADVEFRKGNIDRALLLAENNLASAQRNEFAITTYKTREFVKKEWLVQHLTDKLSFYRSLALKTRNY
jgi:tetratricopeptide (TPR) repeat protein